MYGRHGIDGWPGAFPELGQPPPNPGSSAWPCTAFGNGRGAVILLAHGTLMPWTMTKNKRANSVFNFV